jgi:hypothetical protein
MAHFAELDENNTVIQVIVVNNEDISEGIEEETGIKFCQDLLGGEWKQTSYNSNFRTRFAAPNGSYDPVTDEFVEPQTFPSWTLDADNKWQPPTPKPEDGNYYDWDEESLSWVMIEKREDKILVAVDDGIVNP